MLHFTLNTKDIKGYNLHKDTENYENKGNEVQNGTILTFHDNFQLNCSWTGNLVESYQNFWHVHCVGTTVCDHWLSIVIPNSLIAFLHLQSLFSLISYLSLVR